MPLVSLEADVVQAIHQSLAENDLKRPIRIELRSTGCCDAALGLFLDKADENDLLQQIEGITFVLRPEINELAGEITIGWRGSGFVLKAEKASQQMGQFWCMSHQKVTFLSAIFIKEISLIPGHCPRRKAFIVLLMILALRSGVNSILLYTRPAKK